MIKDCLVIKKVRKSLIGERHGCLLVLEYVGHFKRVAYYLCRCDCGSEKIFRRQSVLGCPSRCCLCPHKHGSESHAWKGCGDLPRDVFNTIYHGAMARGIEFAVTIEYLWDLFLRQEKKCVFTGWSIGFNPTYMDKKSKTASLDRIDSSKGYIEGNLQWVHRIVNKLKKNIPDDIFLAVCLAIAKNRQAHVKFIENITASPVLYECSGGVD